MSQALMAKMIDSALPASSHMCFSITYVFKGFIIRNDILKSFRGVKIARDFAAPKLAADLSILFIQDIWYRYVG